MLPTPESMLKFLHLSNYLEVNSNTPVSKSWQVSFLRHLNKPNDFLNCQAIGGYNTLPQDIIKNTDIVPKAFYPLLKKCS